MSQSSSVRTLADASAALRNRSVTSVQLVQDSLSKIEHNDGAIAAFVHVRSREKLEAEAAEADNRWRQGQERSSVDGIPIGIKDAIDLAGIPTECGSRVLEGHIPQKSATVHEKLVQGGAVVIGKTRTHEFCYGPITPPTRNPLNLSRIPGGSSGGSGAALAAGMVLGALGTDTGGSVRIPASFNGVSGLRPTFGLVSKHGVTTLAWSLDTVGPMGRSISDTALLLKLLSGYDSRDPSSVELLPDAPTDDFSRIKVGVPRRYLCEGLASPVENAFERVLVAAEDLGWKIKEVDLPLVEESVAIHSTIQFAEAAAAHDQRFDAHADLYQEDVRTWLELGFCVSAVDYLRAQRARTVLKRGMLEVLQSVDVIACPTTIMTAPDVGITHVKVGPEPIDLNFAVMRNCAVFGLAGVPALSMPCGFDDEGMPVGLQLASLPFADFQLLAIAGRLERALKLPSSFARFQT